MGKWLSISEQVALFSGIRTAEEPYAPTPELTKNHIIVSVDKLLKEGAVYGKAILDKVLSLIDSPYFPDSFDEGKRVLDNSLFASAREALFKNVLTVVYKTLLQERMDFRKTRVYRNVLAYMIQKNYSLSESVLNEKANAILDTTNSQILSNLLRVVSLHSLGWATIPDHKKTMVKSFVAQLPSSDLDSIEGWGKISELRPFIEKRVSVVTREEFDSLIPFGLPEVLKPRLIQLYLESPNFNSANKFSKILRSFMNELSKEQLTQILSHLKDNSQVTGSIELVHVVEAIKRANKLSIAEVDELLKQQGLVDLIETVDQAQA